MCFLISTSGYRSVSCDTQSTSLSQLLIPCLNKSKAGITQEQADKLAVAFKTTDTTSLSSIRTSGVTKSQEQVHVKASDIDNIKGLSLKEAASRVQPTKRFADKKDQTAEKIKKEREQRKNQSKSSQGASGWGYSFGFGFDEKKDTKQTKEEKAPETNVFQEYPDDTPISETDKLPGGKYKLNTSITKDIFGRPVVRPTVFKSLRDCQIYTAIRFIEARIREVTKAIETAKPGSQKETVGKASLEENKKALELLKSVQQKYLLDISLPIVDFKLVKGSSVETELVKSWSNSFGVTTSKGGYLVVVASSTGEKYYTEIATSNLV